MDAERFDIFCFGLLVGLVLTGCLYEFAADKTDYRREAIERSFAHYDSQTGEWAWNEPAKEQEQRR